MASSPTFTASSLASSFDRLSSLSHTLSTLTLSPPDHDRDDASSNDEIVWDLTESTTSLTESSISLASDLDGDDDFIILARPRSPGTTQLQSATTEDYEYTYLSVLTELSMIHLNPPPPESPVKTRKRAASTPKPTRATPKPKSKKKATTKTTLTTTVDGQAAYPSPAPSPIQQGAFTATKSPPADKPKKVKPKKPKVKKVKPAAKAKTGLGSCPIVDDASSDAGQDPDGAYDTAAQYISSFLSNPGAPGVQSTACRLTLLQSLIIELGLCNSPCTNAVPNSTTTLLPRTLTAAKAFLKARVFLNIREYLAVREQGQAALQAVMHPSKSALIRDIKKKGNRASLKWVKKHGLQVLLVTCYH